MKKAAITLLSALLLVGIIGTVAYAMQSFTVFVIGSLLLSGALFIPLLISMFRSSGGVKPTLFGTSSPGTFTTISHAQNEKANQAVEKTSWIAAAGGIILTVFFFVVLLQYF